MEGISIQVITEKWWQWKKNEFYFISWQQIPPTTCPAQVCISLACCLSCCSENWWRIREHSRMDRDRILDPRLLGKCPNPPGNVAHYLFGTCSGDKASLPAAVTWSRVYWWIRMSFSNQSDEVTLVFLFFFLMHVTNSSVTFGGYCVVFFFSITSMMVLEPWFYVQGISLPLYRRAA